LRDRSKQIDLQLTRCLDRQRRPNRQAGLNHYTSHRYHL
jgi:hypothetical protein